MTYFRQIDPNAIDMATLQVALRSASNYARIIALCFERDDAKRSFFLAAASLNMTSDDYVYIILEFRGLAFSGVCHAKLTFFLFFRCTDFNELNSVGLYQ
jgi:hypothetical protein